MSLRIGFLGVAHMHSYGYAHGLKIHPEVDISGVWDHQKELAVSFSESQKITRYERVDDLLANSDAVIICSENKHHAADIAQAAKAGKHILCEKPLVTSLQEADIVFAAERENDVKIMTAFPCRYSPAFQRVVERVKSGEIGTIKAICATNRGSCPFGWFVDTEVSGGGAMIDHVVHVADLLSVLLEKQPISVQAQTGNQIYSENWEDTAMLTLDYADGSFVTLDSSWSRPKSYKTWGDVTMNIVGDKGVIELDMFGQSLDVFTNSNMRHGLSGYGSNLDAGLVADFIACITNDTPVPISVQDGWNAARIAVLGYESVRQSACVSLK